MQVKLEKLEKTVVKLEIEVSPEKFEEGLQKSYKRNLKNFRVNGFRQGKVPRNIVEKVYGVEVLFEDAVNFIIPDEYDAAVEELNIVPVCEPKYDIITIEKGKLVFTAEVTLKPEVKLGEYKGLEVTERSTEVTEEEIEAELKKVADTNSRMVEVTDRPAKLGDVANIDFTGYLDGVEFDGGKGTGHPLELGSGSFIPGFEDQIVGANAGDEIDVNVTFPEDYHAEDLKGKAVVFKVKVNDIKAKEVPVIDDDFASDVSEFDTLDEYKNSLKDKLAENKAKYAKNAMEAEAIEKATANAEVDVPDCMIDNRVNNQIQEYSQQLSYSGVQLDQYLMYIGKTLEQFKEELAKQAAIDVKQMLVMEAIAVDAKIEVSDEELNEELQKIADQYKMTLEEVKERMGAKNIGYQMDNIKIRKALDMIVAESKKVKEAAKKPAAKKAPAKKTTAKKAVDEATSTEAAAETEAPKKAPAKKTAAKKTTTTKKAAEKKDAE
ncbi:MAG: trigger factor [Ruminococcaceae bacterium]|nr:trigger factor [Oscillospiraceae bacterium]